MKRKMLIMPAIAILGLATACATQAPGTAGQTVSKTTSTITNLLEGVLTRTDIDIKDIAGTYEATGSAVTFKTENALQKAGGVAAAAAIEAQLDPYYEQYGLIGATFTCTEEGQFTLTARNIPLKGTITKQDDGTFMFNFQAFGAIGIGSMTAYIQKTPTSVEIMFDATKLKNLLSIVSKTVGGTLTSTVGTLLDSYDGACMGFNFKKTGAAPASSTQSDAGESDKPTVGGLLQNILKK